MPHTGQLSHKYFMLLMKDWRHAVAFVPSWVSWWDSEGGRLLGIQ